MGEEKVQDRPRCLATKETVEGMENTCLTSHQPAWDAFRNSGSSKICFQGMTSEYKKKAFKMNHSLSVLSHLKKEKIKKRQVVFVYRKKKKLILNTCEH